MSIRFYFCIALAISTLSLPLTSKAQKFQQPTEEELQMTSDPKAPGASAVFLYFQLETDNGNQYYSEYARIKVLTEKGKEWATIEVPYDAVRDSTPKIEGRTIHSDGTVIPLVGKASDLLVFKNRGTKVKVAVFTLPSVEVGSILEYRWTVNQSEVIPNWIIQKDIFVHKAYYHFNPFSLNMASNFSGHIARSSYFYTQKLPLGSKVVQSLKGDYSLDIQDVPAFNHEENSPPMESQRYEVLFYETQFQIPEIFWDNEGQNWSRKLNEFVHESKEIDSAAREITAGAMTPDATARMLYEAVQRLDNTDFSRTKTENERKQLHLKQETEKVLDIWAEKSGSANDIAALYLALARGVGLKADGLMVVNRDQSIFDAKYLSMRQLDDLLVVLHLDGKDIYLDPGSKFCPFGQLDWKHTLTGGIQQNVKGPVYTPSNLTKDAITAHKADLTVDAQGGITGSVALIMNGPVALRYRQLNLTSDTDEVKRQLNESLTRLLPQGVTGEVDKIQGLDNPADFLTATLKVSGQLGTTTGKRLMLPAFFFSTGARPQFVAEEKRTAAVDLHYAEQVIDDAVFHLPAGYTVESAPQAAQLPWEGHAQLIVKTTPGAGSIEIKHVFARAFMLLDPKEYPALRDYYQKLAATDQQQLVLVK